MGSGAFDGVADKFEKQLRRYMRRLKDRNAGQVSAPVENGAYDDAGYTVFRETDDEGNPINNTVAIGSLGGATLDNEENYLITKLFHSLGMVCVENQARI